MISPTCSVSRTANLLSDSEKDVLNSLQQYIENRTNQAKQNLANSLSKLITTSYYLGGDRAAREIGGISVPLGLQGLDPVIERVGASLDTTFGSMSGELTDIIRTGVRNGWSYDHVQKALSEKIRGGWGKSVHFDSIGTTRRVVKVAPNGTLSWDTKTITRPVTLPTDVYAETLARTSMKQAYTGGHFERYMEAGYEGWVYLSVADERTRPRHLALHGRVFLFGTPEEEMARKVMEEHNCRCRPKPWFNDPKRDRPDEEYRAERRKWARDALEEGTDEIPEDDRKFLEELSGTADQDEIKFTQAKTTAAAEQWVRETTKLKFSDYKGIDVKAANEINKSLTYHLNLDRRLEGNIDFIGTCQAQVNLDYAQRLKARIELAKKIYPDIDERFIRKIAESGLIKHKVGGNCFAWSWRPANYAGIGINKKWGKNLDVLNAELKRNVEIGFHPSGCDTLKSTIDHEFGHALDDLYKFCDIDEIALEYKSLCTMGNDKAKDALSLYAMTNRKEFIAEAWSEYLNNPKPRRIAKKVGGIIERTIKETSK